MFTSRTLPSNTFGKRCAKPFAEDKPQTEVADSEDFRLWTGHQSAGSKALVDYRLRNRLGCYRDLAKPF